MSKSKAKLPSRLKPSAISVDIPPIASADETPDPCCVMVGDRFEKRGRRVIDWRVNAIANPPHGSPIVTFVEIDCTACVRLRVADIFEMGFQRVQAQIPVSLL